MELIENNETLSFLGLNPGSYNLLKAEEKEFPGFATPIDEIIKKCEEQGLKIELGRNQSGYDMFLLPANSDDLADSLRFNDLNIDNINDSVFQNLTKILLE